MRLDSAAAVRLESSLKSNPGDLNTRTKLLGYYMQRAYTDANARRRRAAHCRWVVRNCPDKEIAGTPFCQIVRILEPANYRQVKALWDKTVKQRSKDIAVLSNAASFHTSNDIRKAVSLLKRLQRIEPSSADWKERLGHLYHLQSMSMPGKKRNADAAGRALEQWEAALSLLSTEEDRFYMLTLLAPIAVDAKRLNKASHYARNLLQYARNSRTNWNQGNAIHMAHLTLGRVALRHLQVEDAKKHLIASAKTKGSPQLNSFGPSQDLAAELLAQGETKVVIRYLKLCGKFWSMGGTQINAWTKSILESGTTDFMPVFDMGDADK